MLNVSEYNSFYQSHFEVQKITKILTNDIVENLCFVN